MGGGPFARIARVLAIGTAVAVTSVGTSEASADCLYAEVFVERQNNPTLYPLGPNPCLTSTPGTWMLFVGPVDVGHDVPDGAPKRVYVDVRVPVP